MRLDSTTQRGILNDCLFYGNLVIAYLLCLMPVAISPLSDEMVMQIDTQAHSRNPTLTTTLEYTDRIVPHQAPMNLFQLVKGFCHKFSS